MKNIIVISLITFFGFNVHAQTFDEIDLFDEAGFSKVTTIENAGFVCFDNREEPETSNAYFIAKTKEVGTTVRVWQADTKDGKEGVELVDTTYTSKNDLETITGLYDFFGMKANVTIILEKVTDISKPTKVKEAHVTMKQIQEKQQGIPDEDEQVENEDEDELFEIKFGPLDCQSLQ